MAVQVRAEAEEEIKEGESMRADSTAAKVALLYALSRPRGRQRSDIRKATRLCVSPARLMLQVRTFTNGD